jgi:DNA-binding CsgD family transcriptional regulator
LDYALSAVRFSIAAGLSKDAEAAYRDRYVRLSPTIRYFRAHPDACLVNNHMHTGEARLDRDAFHLEFLESLCGARYSLTACWPGECAHHAVHATLLRTREQGPADARLTERYSALRPHLQRAVQLSERMVRAEAYVSAAESLFEVLALGILMISDCGTVVYNNRTAREITDARDGLSVDGTGLHALRRSDDTWLQLVLEGVISRESAVSVDVSVTRKSGARPYGLNLVPVRGPAVWLPSHAVRAIVVISDPERPIVQHGNFAQAFDLTATEARVLALLCAGKTSSDIASALSIAPSTTRLHIEHLLKKSGCHRQSDLVRCALTGSAAWLMRNPETGVEPPHDRLLTPIQMLPHVW